MQAVTVGAFVLQFSDNKIVDNSLAGAELAVLVVILSLLMVSHVKYDTMPKLSKHQLKLHPLKFIGIIAILLVIVLTELIFDSNILFLMLMLYIIYGLIRAAIKWKKVENKDRK